MSSARARGPATQPPELTPDRAELLLVQAFTLGQMQAHGVSPLRESDTAPPLAVSKDVAAETLSRSENTETGLPARVTIGDEVSPLTNDTSIPVSTENFGSLHGGEFRDDFVADTSASPPETCLGLTPTGVAGNPHSWPPCKHHSSR